MVHVPRLRLLKAGGNVMRPPLYYGTYYDLPPITQVVSKAQRILKFKATPLADGLRETYLWYLKHHKKTRQDFGFEDAMLAAARRVDGAKA